MYSNWAFFNDDLEKNSRQLKEEDETLIRRTSQDKLDKILRQKSDEIINEQLFIQNLNDSQKKPKFIKAKKASKKKFVL